MHKETLTLFGLLDIMRNRIICLIKRSNRSILDGIRAVKSLYFKFYVRLFTLN